MAACLWGGMMCPLIPVMKSLPKAWRDEPFRRATPQKLTQGYLRFFEPDVFVETAPGQFESAALSPGENWGARDRFFQFDDLIRTEPGRAPILDAGVSMHYIFEQLFSDEFQFKKRKDPKILLFEGGDQAAKAFFEACYGMFPEGDVLPYVREHYRGALAAKTVVPSVEQWAQIERRQAGYPLYYTTRGASQQFGRGWNETIFVFDPLKATDVMDFWNLRLFTRDVMPVNVHWLAASRELIIERVRRQHRPLPSNPFGVMIGTHIQIARSLDKNAIVSALALTDAQLPQGSWSVQGWYEPIWTTPEEDQGSGPVLAPLEVKNTEVQLPTSTGRSLRIPALSPDGVEFTRGARPAWVNVIRPRFYGDNIRYADALPSAALTGHDEYPPRGYPAQVPTREGYVTFHSFAHATGSFDLPAMQEAIFGWLKARGITAEPSDAGRVADQLIASVGGLASMALLAHPEAVVLFDKMARSRATRANGDTEEFPDRTAKIGEVTSMLDKIQKRPYGRHVTLDRFVDAGALRLGIAVRCDQCAKENWYGLDDIASTNRCERCRKTFDFPQGRVPARDTWKYRVVGPFATAGFAQGGYSVALALRFLAYELGSRAALTFSTSLELKTNGEKLETDFFAWRGKDTFERATQDPALLVGECKSFGTELFKPADIHRLKRLGQLLPGAYLVAAVLKPTLSRAEVTGLRSLARWGWRQKRGDRKPSRLIILTGSELFALGPLYNVWLDAGGRLADAANKYSYIFDLDTLAQATQQVHLGFTDDEIFALRHPPGRASKPSQQEKGATVAAD